MTQSETITKQASDLIRYNTAGWFCREIGLSYPTLKIRLQDNKWTIDQATAINSRHEILIQNLQKP